MKVFFAIYVLGKAVAVFGPLPYSVDVCWEKSKAVVEQIDKDYKEGIFPNQEKIKNREFIRVSCMETDTRPNIEELK